MSRPTYLSVTLYCIAYTSRSFPGQECSAGDSKIPSILYYHQNGSVHSAGAEAALAGMDLEAEDNGLIFVEWFVGRSRMCLLFVIQSDVLSGSSFTSVRRDLTRGRSSCKTFLLSHQARPSSPCLPTSFRTSSRAQSATFARLTRVAKTFGTLFKAVSNSFCRTLTAGKACSKERCVKLQ